MKKHVLISAWYCMVCAVVFFVMDCLCGCQTRYIVVPEYHKEYTHTIDSFFRTDTVMNEKTTVIRELTPEDSLLLAKYGFRLRDNERFILLLERELEKERSRQNEVVHDTIMKSDSIMVPFPVERELTVWEKMKENTAGAIIMLALSFVLLLFIIRRLPRSSTKKE